MVLEYLSMWQSNQEMVRAFLLIPKVAQVFGKKHKRVAKTFYVEEGDKEVTNTNEDKTNLILRKKHKVTSNSEKTTPCAIFGNTSCNEQPELEPLTLSIQNTNLGVCPSDPAPSTLANSNSNT